MPNQMLMDLLNDAEFLKDPKSKTSVAELSSAKSLEEFRNLIIKEKDFYNLFSKIVPPIDDNWKLEDGTDFESLIKEIVFNQKLKDLSTLSEAELLELCAKKTNSELKAHLGLNVDLEPLQYEALLYKGQKFLLLLKIKENNSNEALINLINVKEDEFQAALTGFGFDEDLRNNILPQWDEELEAAAHLQLLKNILAKLSIQQLSQIGNLETLLEQADSLTTEEKTALKEFTHPDSKTIFAYTKMYFFYQTKKDLSLNELLSYSNSKLIQENLNEVDRREFNTQIIFAILEKGEIGLEMLTKIAIAPLEEQPLLLKEVGISDHTLLNEGAAKKIQETAAKSFLSLKFPGPFSTYLCQLSFEMLEKILKDPVKIEGLENCDNIRYLAYILEVPPESIPEELTSIFYNRDLAKQITNSVIARKLLVLNINLTDESVKDINELLTKNPPLTVDNTVSILNEIQKILEINDATIFNELFGLDPHGNIIEPSFVEAIINLTHLSFSKYLEKAGFNFPPDLDVVDALNSREQEFLDKLPEPFKNIDLAFATRLRTSVATDYFYKKLAYLPFEKLKELAKEQDPEVFKAVLNVSGLDDKDEFFKPEDIEAYQIEAAKQVVKIIFENCYDKELLSKLLEGDSETTRYFEEQYQVSFEEIFLQDENFQKSMMGLANLRMHLLSADKNELIDILEKPDLSLDLRGWELDPRIYDRQTIQKKALEIYIITELAKLPVDAIKEINSFEKFLESQKGLSPGEIEAIKKLYKPEFEKLVISHAYLNYIFQDNAKIELNLETLISYLNTEQIQEGLDKDLQKKFSTRLLELIFSNQEFSDPILIQKLAVAESLDDFKSILQDDLGITNHSVLTEDTKLRLQKFLTNRFFILEAPSETIASYLSELPFEKQQEILKDPEKTQALKSSEDNVALAKALDLPEVFLSEANRNLASKIFNIRIADKLANLGIVLNPHIVNEINKFLRDNPFLSEKSYKSLVVKISKLADIQDKTSFNLAFGLDGTNNVIEPTFMQEVIANSARLGAKMLRFNEIGGKNPIFEAILAIMLVRDPSEFAKLKSTDPDTITIALASIQGKRKTNDHVPFIFHKSEIEEVLGITITPEEYKTVIRAAIKAGMSNKIYEKSLQAWMDKVEHDVLRLSQVLDKLLLAEKDSKDELIRLSKLTSLDFLAPELLGSATKTTAEMEAYYSDVGELCDYLVNHLQFQQKRYAEILASMPDPLPESPFKRELVNLRDKILSQKKLVDERLAIYEPLKRVMYGDKNSPVPSMQVGIIGMVKTAKAAENSEINYSLFSSNFKDYPNAELDVHLPKDYASELDGSIKPSSAQVQKAISQGIEVVEKPKPGFFREHVIPPTGANTNPGRIVEEHLAANRTIAAGEEKLEFPQHKKLTVSAFPTEKHATSSKSSADDDKIIFAMAFALKLLADLKNPLSSNCHIILRGSSKEELRYLWTAFMILGEINPNYRFGKEAIKVFGPFSPNEECTSTLGFNSWKSNALYHSMKQHYSVSLLEQSIDSVNKSKKTHDKTPDQVLKDSKAICNFFKDKIKPDLVDDLKEDKSNDLGI